jgi:hypothetical protein
MTRFQPIAVIAVLLWLLMAVANAGALVGDTDVPFKADRTVVWHGKTYVGKVYAVPGMQRHEQEINGLHPVAIVRADRKTVYLMLPELHIYTELPFPPAVAEYDTFKSLGDPVREERFGGEKAHVYRIEWNASDGSLLDGWGWITGDGIVLKVDGAYTEPGHSPKNGSLVLSNVVRGPQDLALFDVPKGFSRLPPEGVEALFNLRFANQPR